MNFKSIILKNIQFSKDYFEGEYYLGFINKPISILYAITDTVENKFEGEKETNREEKFSDLEQLFEKFIETLNVKKYLEYKKDTAQKLVDDSVKHKSQKEKKTEKDRLNNSMYLDHIGIEWRKDFWDVSNQQTIITKERYEIVLNFTDPLYINYHVITVEINAENFEIQAVFLE